MSKAGIIVLNVMFCVMSENGKLYAGFILVVVVVCDIVTISTCSHLTYVYTIHLRANVIDGALYVTLALYLDAILRDIGKGLNMFVVSLNLYILCIFKFI